MIIVIIIKMIYSQSQQRNHLLLKDDIGRPKPFTRDLPKEGFSFGMPLYRDKEGVAARKHRINDLSIMQ